jgi:hypothetical protein
LNVTEDGLVRKAPAYRRLRFSLRRALTLLAINLYAARDVIRHGDGSWCLTLAGTPIELRTPPSDGVATDGQVG